MLRPFEFLWKEFKISKVLQSYIIKFLSIIFIIFKFINLKILRRNIFQFFVFITFICNILKLFTNEISPLRIMTKLITYYIFELVLAYLKTNMYFRMLYSQVLVYFAVKYFRDSKYLYLTLNFFGKIVDKSTL